ncbi:MAG: hypothetical protein ACTSXX_14215 [Candidatus Baldrarchaeia archaeon]
MAKKRGRNIENIIIESVAELLDPESKIEVYKKLHEK